MQAICMMLLGTPTGATLDSLRAQEQGDCARQS